MKKHFPTLTDANYEKLTILEKREYHIQTKWWDILPFLFFVLLIQTIGIILGFVWIIDLIQRNKI